MSPRGSQRERDPELLRAEPVGRRARRACRRLRPRAPARGCPGRARRPRRRARRPASRAGPPRPCWPSRRCPPCSSILRTWGSASRATSCTTGTRLPSASSRPSTSLRSTMRSASTSGATMAASWSLSPNRISSTATESFSLRIGTARASRSAPSAARALFDRTRSARSACVSSTCATEMPRVSNASSYTRMSSDCPAAAAACSLAISLGRELVPELLHAERDGAARDDDERGALARRDGHRQRVEDLAPGRERARADLDDDAPRLRDGRADRAQTWVLREELIERRLEPGHQPGGRPRREAQERCRPRRPRRRAGRR